jgi:hypothetical protein
VSIRINLARRKRDVEKEVHANLQYIRKFNEMEPARIVAGFAAMVWSPSRERISRIPFSADQLLAKLLKVVERERWPIGPDGVRIGRASCGSVPAPDCSQAPGRKAAGCCNGIRTLSSPDACYSSSSANSPGRQSRRYSLAAASLTRASISRSSVSPLGLPVHRWRMTPF